MLQGLRLRVIGKVAGAGMAVAIPIADANAQIVGSCRVVSGGATPIVDAGGGANGTGDHATVVDGRLGLRVGSRVRVNTRFISTAELGSYGGSHEAMRGIKYRELLAICGLRIARPAGNRTNPHAAHTPRPR